MKYRWLVVGLAAILALAGFYLDHAAAHHRQLLTLKTLCQQYLIESAQLPNAKAWVALERLTVPGTQARVSARQLSQEETNAHLTLTHVQASLSQITLSEGQPLELRASVTITRHFSPKGASAVAASATFWIADASHPKIEAVSFNTNQNLPAQGPDSFNLNLWNTIPAGPLPHGN